MSRDIDTGVNKIAAALTRKQNEEQSSQWRDLRNKLDSLLLSTHTFKTDEARGRCQAIDQMDMDERVAHISKYWGPTCLERAHPLLQQLDAIERIISKTEDQED